MLETIARILASHKPDCNCFVCRSARSDDKYRAAWGISGELKPHPVPVQCAYLGKDTGEQVQCKTCAGSKLKVFECAVYGQCTTGEKDSIPPFAKCNGGRCPSYKSPEQTETTKATEAPSVRGLHWSYGVTTVPARKADLLPRTLASLRTGGFDKPRLFVDGAHGGYEGFGLDVTYRYPTIRIHSNFVLSLMELYCREPTAARYALFQDDFVTYKNLRAYLDRVPYPEKGYKNLYTFPSNQAIVPNDKTGWYESRSMNSGQEYHGKMQQYGRGAVALVFNREAVVALLTSHHMITRPESGAWKKVDGGCVESLNKAGFREFVHNPSLVQHVGRLSTVGNAPHQSAVSFRGETFDCLELLQGVQ